MSSRHWLGLVCLSLVGCTMRSGFNCHRFHPSLADDAFQITDQEIQEIQTLKPQLKLPCRIAVALTEGAGDWRWTPADKQQMQAWAHSLKQEGIASEVIFMSSLVMQEGKLKDLRGAAARYGADALLLVHGTANTNSRLNMLAALNLTVVGGFLVPASHRDALFRMEAGLLDVNNGFLYATVSVEGEASKIAPTFLIEEADAIEGAKQAAQKAFAAELLLRMRNLQASYVAAQAVPPSR